MEQRYDEAAPLIEERVALDRATFPPNHMERIYGLSLLAKCLALRDAAGGGGGAAASPRCVLCDDCLYLICFDRVPVVGVVGVCVGVPDTFGLPPTSTKQVRGGHGGG